VSDGAEPAGADNPLGRPACGRFFFFGDVDFMGEIIGFRPGVV
jgi:hypothetical protein